MASRTATAASCRNVNVFGSSRMEGSAVANLARCWSLLVVIAAGLLGIAGQASADGMLVPIRAVRGPSALTRTATPYTLVQAQQGEAGQLPSQPERQRLPNFAIKYHRVSVSIQGQVATTEIDQVFENRSDMVLVPMYVFPLPSGAAITEFEVYDQGRKVTGRILDRKKAREVYQNLVRNRRDPGLLEYIGKDTYQVTVSSVFPDQEKRIQVKYTELLKQEGNITTYVYPLGTERFSSEPIDEVRLDLQVESPDLPILSVYSPTHAVQISRPSENRATVHYEEKKTRPAHDFILHYTTSAEEIAPQVLTHREPGEDGFFLLMASPSITEEPGTGDAQPKDVVFVLDVSGSMAGEKLEQAKRALLSCLSSLKAGDRFQIVSFGLSASALTSSGGNWLPVSSENVGEAKKLLDGLEPKGRTDIASALETALKLDFDPNRPAWTVLLSDGTATVGVKEDDEILLRVREANKRDGKRIARIFALGLGYIANARFLERLSQENGGASESVLPTEEVEARAAAFFNKVSRPILKDVQLNVEGVEVYDVFPGDMPDIFAGSQLIVLGRYKSQELVEAKVDLSGVASPERQHFASTFAFPATEPRNSYIASLWAARKIQHLLDQIRLQGESKELVDEVVRLSKQYGILTEYTAFLTEPTEQERQKERERRRSRRLLVSPSLPSAGAYGAGAYGAGGYGAPGYGGQYTSGAAGYGAYGAGAPGTAAAGVPGQLAIPAPAEEVQIEVPCEEYNPDGKRVDYSKMRVANNQAYVSRDGNWMDTRYVEGQPVIEVKTFSDAYFQLSEHFPGLNPAFALGEKVLVIINGKPIQIDPEEGQESFTDSELKQLGPEEK